MSYAREDDAQGWVSAVCQLLAQDQCEYSPEPLRFFFDTHAIRDMHDWQDRIQSGLRSSKIMLTFVSPNYFASEWCFREWVEHLRHQVHRLMGFESIAQVVLVPMAVSERTNSDRARWQQQLERIPSAAGLRGWQ